MKNKKVIFEVIKDNIVNMKVDAIVNSANQYMAKGAGICGAIFNAAGTELEEECEKIGSIETGKAIITGAYNLPCKKIIHVLAPKYYLNEANREEKLKSCYIEIIELSEKEKFKNIAIPCIGMGIYKWPIELGAKIAVETAINSLSNNTSIEKIYFVCGTEVQYEMYHHFINEIQKTI